MILVVSKLLTIIVNSAKSVTEKNLYSQYISSRRRLFFLKFIRNSVLHFHCLLVVFIGDCHNSFPPQIATNGKRAGWRRVIPEDKWLIRLVPGLFETIVLYDVTPTRTPHLESDHNISGMGRNCNELSVPTHLLDSVIAI